MGTAAGNATRMRILDASELLILDNGYRATSIEDIVGPRGNHQGHLLLSLRQQG